MNLDKYPKTVYKYRDWSNKNHKKVLLDNEIFMASPKDFNDPFDCRIIVNYHLLNTPEKLEEYIDKLFVKLNDVLLKEKINFKLQKQNLLKRLQNINQYQKEREEIEFQEMNKHFGIFSLSARWNSILMWSHYGNFHKGICIGFNEKKMRNSGLFGKGSPVHYTNYFPEINPLIDEDIMIKSFKQTHSKGKEWEYEKEYRLMNLYKIAPSNNQRKIIIPENCVEEINLGTNISKSDKQEIIEVAKNRNIRIYQLERVSFKFELKRIEL